MPLHQSPPRTGSARAAQGFSLVEITLALGIMAFCMIPLIGMIPTGLRVQQNAQEGSRATSALNMLATAVRSSQFVSQANGKATYQLPMYLSDTGTPITFTVGDPPSTHAYQILEDGTIRKSTDTTTVTRETLYIQLTPPATDAQLALPSPNGVQLTTAVSVYAVVAWPVLSTDIPTMNDATARKNRQGFVESLITYVPRH